MTRPHVVPRIGPLFVHGGAAIASGLTVDGNAAVPSVEVYDYYSNAWNIRAVGDQFARVGHEVYLHDGRYYSAGGVPWPDTRPKEPAPNWWDPHQGVPSLDEVCPRLPTAECNLLRGWSGSGSAPAAYFRLVERHFGLNRSWVSEYWREIEGR